MKSKPKRTKRTPAPRVAGESNSTTAKPERPQITFLDAMIARATCRLLGVYRDSGFPGTFREFLDHDDWHNMVGGLPVMTRIEAERCFGFLEGVLVALDLPGLEDLGNEVLADREWRLPATTQFNGTGSCACCD